MLHKGLVKTITLALALVCVFYLSFSFISNKYEKKAEAYAEGSNAKYNAFLDSVSKEKTFLFGYTVQECREREIGLGLDLKGGMNVVMEVSVPDILKNKAGDKSLDAKFVKSIKEAEEAQKKASINNDFLSTFIARLKENDPGCNLADYFSNRNTSEKIKRNSTDADVKKVLEQDINDAIDKSFNVLRSRIDRFGVVQPNIQRLTGSSRVLIEMPGVKEPERVRKLLQGSANLEFWETAEMSEIAGSVIALNNYLVSENSANKVAKEEVKKDSAAAEVAKQDTAKEDDLFAQTETETVTENKDDAQNPLFAVLNPNFTQEGGPGYGPIIGYASASDTAKVSEYFRKGLERGIIPSTINPSWTVKPDKRIIIKGAPQYALVALKGKATKGKTAKAALSGDVVTDAKADFNQHSVNAEVSMTMSTEGARKWAVLTRNNINKSVAIVLDGYVYSYPNVKGEIAGGRSSITGDFTPDEAKDLATVLTSGKMSAPAKIVQEDIVGPSIGQEAIQNGLISFVIAFIMILIYMIFYYGLVPGLVADLALIINVFFIFGFLGSFRAVLTLPGIAGIVLTLGMAVDANVLVFERSREELGNGSNVRDALSKGYSNALSAILDSNLTSVITGVILFFFGTGPIKGFATTLLIGIFCTLLTAVLVSRLIFESILDRKKDHSTITFTTDFTKNWFQNVSYDFIKNSKKFIWVSIACAFIAIGSLCINKLKGSIDFTGGRNYVVRFENNVSTEDVNAELKKEFGEATVSVITIGSQNQVRISTNFNIDDESANADDDIETRLYNGLQKFIANDQVSKELFIHRYVNKDGIKEATEDDDVAFGIQSSAKVGPSMASDILINAFIAVILSLIAIGLYIFIRFRDLAFSFGSVIALFHDAFLILGIFSLCYKFMPFSMEIDQSFIAAILTVIGYSINDKVVIFDRIREYRNKFKNRADEDNINEAICSTLSRTFSTSLSTLLVLIIIFFFGGEVIRGFIFAMTLGVIIGTYSSIFIAAPVANAILAKKASKKEEVVEVKA